MAESIFFEIEGLLVPFFIEEYSISSSQSIIIKLVDVPDKNKALRFIDCKVFIEETRKNICKKSQLDYSNVIGYMLNDQNGNTLGIVTGVVDIPENFLLTVLYGKKEILVPFNEYALIKIEKRKKIITLEVQPGLIDLN
jgi:16S rRNA processing protein RimM